MRWASPSTCSRCSSRSRAQPAGWRSGTKCCAMRIRRSRVRARSTRARNSATTSYATTVNDTGSDFTQFVKLLPAFFLLLLTAAAVGAPLWYRAQADGTQATPPVGAGFDGAKAFEHLRQLVAIGPRPAGSTGIRQARAYITRQLSSLGFTVEEQAFTAQSPYGPVEMVNLIVRLPGRRPDRLLITGHYDTKLMPNQRFVGASDGGSSAAMLIELARVLKDRPRELTYEIVWFDGEEAFVDWQGLDHTYGSRYYVQAATKAKALASIKTMI